MNMVNVFLLVHFAVEVVLVSTSVQSKTPSWIRDLLNAIWGTADRLRYADAKETLAVSTAVLLQMVGMVLQIFNSCSKD